MLRKKKKCLQGEEHHPNYGHGSIMLGVAAAGELHKMDGIILWSY